MSFKQTKSSTEVMGLTDVHGATAMCVRQRDSEMEWLTIGWINNFVLSNSFFIPSLTEHTCTLYTCTPERSVFEEIVQKQMERSEKKKKSAFFFFPILV